MGNNECTKLIKFVESVGQCAVCCVGNNECIKFVKIIKFVRFAASVGQYAVCTMKMTAYKQARKMPGGENRKHKERMNKDQNDSTSCAYLKQRIVHASSTRAQATAEKGRAVRPLLRLCRKDQHFC